MTDDPRPRAENTRQQIIQAAYELFLQHGFHGTSMRQVAECAGIALGGIYNHFQGKEQIFVAVIETYHPIYAVLNAADQAGGDNVAEIVRSAAAQMVRQFEARPGMMNIFFIEMVEFRGRHVPQVFQKMFPQALAFAERTFRSRPELRPIPLHLLLRAFIGMYFSYVITETLLAGALPKEQRQGAFESFVDIFLHGILKEEASA